MISKAFSEPNVEINSPRVVPPFPDRELGSMIKQLKVYYNGKL